VPAAGDDEEQREHLGSRMSYLVREDGTRLRASIRGDGPAVVLVHGWKQSHRLWDRVIPLLECDFRVVAFDLRGMGESDKPGDPYTFHELADDLGFVLRELDLDEVTLVGWSMGCSVSLEYLRLDGSRVARLVLMNGPIKLVRTEDFPLTMTQEELDGYLGDMEATWPLNERAFVHDTFVDPQPDLVEWLLSIALQTPLDRGLAIVRAQAELNHVPFLPKIRVPVLALYGRHDPYYPTELAGFIAEHVPDGRAVILEGSAHNPPIEEPALFCELVGAFALGEPLPSRG
jgi:non-heme chloroperoxidase